MHRLGLDRDRRVGVDLAQGRLHGVPPEVGPKDELAIGRAEPTAERGEVDSLRRLAHVDTCGQGFIEIEGVFRGEGGEHLDFHAGVVEKKLVSKR